MSMPCCLCEPMETAQSRGDDTHAVAMGPMWAREHGLHNIVWSQVPVGSKSGPSIGARTWTRTQVNIISGVPENTRYPGSETYQPGRTACSDVEAPQKCPCRAACASLWRQPSPLAMIHMRWRWSQSGHESTDCTHCVVLYVGGLQAPAHRQVLEQGRGLT